MKISGRVIALLLALMLGSVCQSVMAQACQQATDSGLPAEAEQAMFAKGQTLYNQGLYGEAIVILNESLASYPNGPIKDLSLLWLGRSYLAQGDIANAEKVGLRLKAVPDTPFVTLYEEELRVARQNYANAAAPKHSQRTETAHRVSHDQASTPNQATNAAPAPVVEAATQLAAVTNSESQTTSAEVVPLPAVVAARSSKPSNTETASQPLPSLPPASAGEVKDKGEVQSGPVSKLPSKTVPPVATPVAAAKEPARVATPAAVGQPSLLSRIEQVAGAEPAAVTYRLVIVNQGTAPAKDLTIRFELSSSLDYSSSDPLPLRQELLAQKQVLTFRLPGVEPGQSKVIQIAARQRNGAPADAAQIKHSVFYKDSKGSFYHTP